MRQKEVSSIYRLKQEKQWGGFRIEKTGGRPTKVFYAASGRKTGTSSQYAHSWVTYDEAVNAVSKHRFTGVGFVIPESYFFLDIDHRAQDDPLVMQLLNAFPTYAERSVSGEGIHIYGKCDLERIPLRDGKLDKRYYSKNSRLGIELYIGGITNRYAAFTGDVIQDEPIQDCTEAVLMVLEEYMLKKKDVQTPPVITDAPEDMDLDVVDVICDLRRAQNGAKFSRLFDAGDTSDYGSHSEADAALCAMIAFRTGNNPALIDAVFRDSALYRAEKWERDDYRESTIACGVEACRGVFHYSLRERPPFVDYLPAKNTEIVVATKLAQHIRGNLRYIFVNDTALGGVRRYVYRDGAYRLVSREMLLGIIKKYITDYDEHLVRVHTLNEVYELLTTDNVFVSQNEVDADENIINFENGLLRLSDLKLLPHSPDVLSTIQIPCKWKGYPIATPNYDRYMNTLTGRNKAIRNVLEEFSGTCISNVKGWRMKKALFLYGPGNSGKSVLKTLVEHLVGKGNYISMDLAEIEARFGTSSLYGKRLAGSSDMSFLTVAEMKTFKKCTGGDSLFAEFKGQNGFEFVFNGLLWFCMNRLPKFGGDDGQWVYDRILQIPCDNVIAEENQDKCLLEKLLMEEEGIVYKLVMALRNVVANGYRFSEPISVKLDRQRYRESNSTVITFFQDCMMLRAPGKLPNACTASKVYSAYQGWCKDNNRGYAKSAREFRSELAAHLGLSPQDLTVRRREGMVYKNYTLTPEAAEAYTRGIAYCYDNNTADEFLK